MIAATAADHPTVGVPPSPDPFLDRLARLRALSERFDSDPELTDADLERTMAAIVEAEQAMVETRPTTMAGMAAALGWVIAELQDNIEAVDRWGDGVPSLLVMLRTVQSGLAGGVDAR